MFCVQVAVEDARITADFEQLFLQLTEEAKADPAFHARFRQQTGDILFANNFVTLHSRSEFEDHPDPALRRKMVRYVEDL